MYVSSYQQKPSAFSTASTRPNQSNHDESSKSIQHYTSYRIFSVPNSITCVAPFPHVWEYPLVQKLSKRQKDKDQKVIETLLLSSLQSSPAYMTFFPFPFYPPLPTKCHGRTLSIQVCQPIKHYYKTPTIPIHPTSRSPLAGAPIWLMPSILHTVPLYLAWYLAPLYGLVTDGCPA